VSRQPLGALRALPPPCWRPWLLSLRGDDSPGKLRPGELTPVGLDRGVSASSLGPAPVPAADDDAPASPIGGGGGGCCCQRLPGLPWPPRPLLAARACQRAASASSPAMASTSATRPAMRERSIPAVSCSRKIESAVPVCPPSSRIRSSTRKSRPSFAGAGDPVLRPGMLPSGCGGGGGGGTYASEKVTDCSPLKASRADCQSPLMR